MERFNFINYAEWLAAAKTAGFVVLTVSSGKIAQNNPRGECCGGWFYNGKHGWLELPEDNQAFEGEGWNSRPSHT
jgi:hypothetical protein